MSKETILVTGTAGFIGFYVAKRLLEKGFGVVGVDSFNNYYPVVLKEERNKILCRNSDFINVKMNLADRNGVEKLKKDFKFSRICHLAAQAGVRYSLQNPYAYEESNLTSFLNILELARHAGVQRLVYASSSSVYGGNTKMPFSEDDNVDKPISLYAATKKANELMAHCYSHLFGFQTVGLRFFTVYGPWGRPDMAIWLFAEAIRHKQKIKVFNYGNMKRDFTFIEDIVNGVEASFFAENLDKAEVFNLGNHRSENLMDVIGIIEKEMGSVAQKEMLPIQPGDVPESFADIEKASRNLGFFPHTSIREGIPKFISWFNEHKELTDNIRKLRDKFI